MTAGRLQKHLVTLRLEWRELKMDAHSIVIYSDLRTSERRASLPCDLTGDQTQDTKVGLPNSHISVLSFWGVRKATYKLLLLIILINFKNFWEQRADGASNVVAVVMANTHVVVLMYRKKSNKTKQRHNLDNTIVLEK